MFRVGAVVSSERTQTGYLDAMPNERSSPRVQASAIATVPEARPLSGAAALPGPEAALAADFIERAAMHWSNSILAPEVPLRDGVADLIRVRLSVGDAHEALWGAISLARLDDRLLFKLASLRPNQPYLIQRLIGSSSDERLIAELASGGWIDLGSRTLIRHRHLVDDIAGVTSYEFKVRDGQAGLRQAALRRSAVTRSYLVTEGTPKGAFPERSEFARLGVGWISLGRRQRPAHHIAAARSFSPRWARYFILRGIVRGLEREVPAY